MYTLIKRACFILTASAAVFAPAFVSTVSAATGSWSWADISGQLSTRTNRPIWAMANAGGTWFYTDGLDLWNTGQVYRFDGSTQVNITTNIRNAGLSRVDEIISNGESIIFLKDVYRIDNAVEAVRYRDGAYTNITLSIRQALDGNEGVSSLVGRNGAWVMVTTRARLVRFSESFSSYTRIQAPADMKQLAVSEPALRYSAHNRMDRGTHDTSYAGVTVTPVANTFLISVGRTYMYSAPSSATFYRYDGQNLTKISGPTLTNGEYSLDVLGVASNNTNVLVLTEHRISFGRIGSIYAFDGSSWNSVSNYWHSIPDSRGRVLDYFEQRDNFSVQWDGSQWLVISGKNLYRIINNRIENLGQTRDYFVTGASNNNGTILLGGAVSNVGVWDPTLPLTAKLVRVLNDNGASETTNTTTNNQTGATTVSGTSYWTWFEPSQSTIRRDQIMSYNIGTWSQYGIKKVDIVVNGVVRRTCDYGRAYNNQLCTVTLYGTDYGVNNTIAINAKVIDGKDRVVWSPLQYLNVTETPSSAVNTTVPQIPSTPYSNASIWVWSNPETSTFKTNETVTFAVGAYDPEGLQRIETYVNGAIWNSCVYGTVYGNRECITAIPGSSFTAGSDIFANAKVTDINGNVTWSSARTYHVNAPNITTTSNVANVPANPDTSDQSSRIWTWSTPDVSSFTTNNSATFSIGAWDPQGIQRIEILVNGQVKQTCNFGGATGNRECSTVINGNPYAPGSSVFVNANVVDGNGNITWSSFRTYTITAGSTNTSAGTGTTVQNRPGYISITSNPTTLSTNVPITFTANGSDQDGINRIEILVNGTLVKICTGTTACTYVGGPYTDRTSVSFGARLVDKLGYVMWTGYQTIYR